MEMGSGSEYFKVILYFALVLFSMGLLVLPFISSSSPEFVVTIIVLVVNGVTAIATYMLFRFKNKNR